MEWIWLVGIAVGLLVVVGILAMVLKPRSFEDGPGHAGVSRGTRLNENPRTQNINAPGNRAAQQPQRPAASRQAPQQPQFRQQAQYHQQQGFVPAQGPVPQFQGVPESVVRLVMAGQYILAIKELRDHSQLGLAEAKHVVDSIRAHLNNGR